MEIKTVKINELKPHPKNPRVHPDSAIDKLVRSIKEYGWTNPILVSADGYILAGHARLKAAEKAGIEEVPVIYLPLEGAKAEAYLIADNRLQDETDWDYEKLKDLLQDLDTGEFDLELTGFDMSEIEDLMTQLHELGEIIEDEAPEPPEEPITKPGDLWILGKHRLLCGDSTKAKDVERLMNGEKADMVFTDPPYNVNYGDKASMLEEYQKGHSNVNSIKNDNMDNAEFLRFLTSAFENIYSALCPGGPFYICHAETTGLEFRKAVLNSGLLLKQCLVWVKNSLVLGRQDYQWIHEPILYGWKPGAAHKWYGGFNKTTVFEDRPNLRKMKKEELIKFAEELLEGKHHTTVIREDKPTKSAEHPTMKPVKLIGYLINNSSKIGDKVLDIFGGSGSTLIAAEQLDRICYIMELEPAYCDVIVKRWENFTGKKAELLDK
jgi:DNA modification methylase